jgi:hypothetical protein
MTTYDRLMQTTPAGPSDTEVVSLLQRMASARAQLLKAEQAASSPEHGANRRRDDIEEAHADVLWAQARLLASARPGKATQALEAAVAREKALLRRTGFRTFREYLDERTSPPTEDVHLALARREYEAAQAAWDQLQDAVITAGGPTVILDLTGEAPRRID